MQPALYSIPSLLCTSTNATTHECMFTHARRPSNGCSIPTWLTHLSPDLMKNHARTNKYEPNEQEVELIVVNPEYTYVKLSDGRETSVSIRHLAPKGDTFIDTHYQEAIEENQQSADSFINQNESLVTEAYEPLLETPRKSIGESTQEENSLPSSRSPDYFRTTTDGTLRQKEYQRPKRQRCRPSYLTDYITE